MDYEQLQRYQQSLLDRALTEGIRRNGEQTKTWSEYKERHEKVIEGLETFREELTVSCMVPIGKKAMMKGKLTHTNEVLVSLGEGYFAKYSAAQAVALCNRRIKRANDILDSLEKERNLYEMRQKIPNSFDVFSNDERKEFVEHWDKEKLDDWRVQHRQREKEYRKKLAELRSTEKPEIQSEEDLFNKLDALELQEELEDELNRLEAARPDFYTQDLEDGEVYDESESDAGSDESEATASEDESNSDGDEKRLIIDETKTSSKSTVSASLKIQSDSSKANLSIATTQEIGKSESKSVRSKFFDSSSNDSSSDNSTHKTTETEGREKRVVFGEPQVKYFRNADRIATVPQDSETAIASTSAASSRPVEVETPNDAESEEEDEVIRIEFKHSGFEPEIPEVENESIESPRDIYRMLSKPKSILKKSPNRVQQQQQQHNNYVPPVDYSSDEETEAAPAGVSAYSTIVKEIREHVPDAAVGNPTIESVKQKRPVSKFKRDRANVNRSQ